MEKELEVIRKEMHKEKHGRANGWRSGGGGVLKKLDAVPLFPLRG